MGPSCFQPRLDQSVSAQPFQDSVMGHGVPPVLRIRHRLPQPVPRIPADGRVHRAFLFFDVVVDQSLIPPGDRMVRQLL